MLVSPGLLRRAQVCGIKTKLHLSPRLNLTLHGSSSSLGFRLTCEFNLHATIGSFPSVSSTQDPFVVISLTTSTRIFALCGHTLSDRQRTQMCIYGVYTVRGADRRCLCFEDELGVSDLGSFRCPGLVSDSGLPDRSNLFEGSWCPIADILEFLCPKMCELSLSGL